MRKIFLLSVILVSLGASAQIDLSLIDSVFGYVHTTKFRQEYADSMKAMRKRYIDSMPTYTKKQRKRKERLLRESERYKNEVHAPESYYLQNTCLASPPGYCVPGSERGEVRWIGPDSIVNKKYKRLFEGTKIYSPSQDGCKDTLLFKACFIQPDTIELIHFFGTWPFGEEERLRFSCNPDKSISFIKKDNIIYN